MKYTINHGKLIPIFFCKINLNLNVSKYKFLKGEVMTPPAQTQKDLILKCITHLGINM